MGYGARFLEFLASDDQDLRPDRLLEQREDLAREGEPEDTYVDVGAILANLPATNQDLLLLIYRNGLKQKAIADLLGCTQVAISCALKKATRRFWYEARRERLGVTPEYCYEHLKEIALPCGPPNLERFARIVAEICRCPNQSVAAERSGTTQGLVRHNIMRATDEWLPALVALDSEKYLPILAMLHLYRQEGRFCKETRHTWTDERRAAVGKAVSAARAKARAGTEERAAMGTALRRRWAPVSRSRGAPSADPRLRIMFSYFDPDPPKP